MDKNLETQLIYAIFQFKKLINSGLGIEVSDDKSGINMTELILMNAIEGNTHDSKCNTDMAYIRGFLSVSKGAVSQMLGSLEKKGFINRDIDKSNRRNLIVTLTPEGREVLRRKYNEFSDGLKKIIGRLGEDEVKQMIKIVNRMIEITNDLRAEAKKEEACTPARI